MGSTRESGEFTQTTPTSATPVPPPPRQPDQLDVVGEAVDLQLRGQGAPLVSPRASLKPHCVSRMPRTPHMPDQPVEGPAPSSRGRTAAAGGSASPRSPRLPITSGVPSSQETLELLHLLDRRREVGVRDQDLAPAAGQQAACAPRPPCRGCARGGAPAPLRSAKAVRHPRRAVPAAVVDHQQLVGVAAAGEVVQRLAQPRPEARLLVVGGNDDGQFDAVSRSCDRNRETGQDDGVGALQGAFPRPVYRLEQPRRHRLGQEPAGGLVSQLPRPPPDPGLGEELARGARRTPRRPPAAPGPRRPPPCRPWTGCARRPPAPWRPSPRGAAGRTPPRGTRGRAGGRRPQRPRDLPRRHACRDSGPAPAASRSAAESGRMEKRSTRQGIPACAQPADRPSAVGTSFDLGLEDPRNGDPRPPPRAQPPGRPEQRVERRRRPPGSPARSVRRRKPARCGETVRVGSCQE